MFTNIYVTIQGSQVLQERWLKEADQDRLVWLVARLRRVRASK